MLSTFRGMPWQVTAVLGLAVLAISLQLSKAGDAIEREVAIARNAGQPEAAMLAGFDAARDMTVSGEVHLMVRLDPKQMLTVSDQVAQPNEAGIKTLVRRVFLLQDPSDKAGARVRGAILLPDEDVGRFLGLVRKTYTKENRRGQVVALNGIALPDSPLGAVTMDRIGGLGLQPAEDFLFVSPFLDGREVAFQPRDRSWRIFVGGVAGLGAALLVLAIGKRIRIIRAAIAAGR